MYTSTGMMPANVSSNFYSAMTMGFSVPLAAMMTPGLVTGVSTLPEFAPAVAPAAQGALVSVATRATTDSINGGVSTPREYLISATIGVVAGTITAGQGLLTTGAVSSAASAVESRITSGSINANDVTSNTIGAAAAVAVTNGVSSVPILKPFALTIGNVAGYAATALTTVAIQKKEQKETKK